MINQISKIKVIGFYTFKEIFKSRIVLNVLLLGFLLGLITYIASEFTYGVPSRVALDFGFGTLSLTSIAVALFLGVGLISQEIENRTVYMVLSRPVDRSSFLIGRILGMLGIQLLNFVILGGLALSIYILYAGTINQLIMWTLIYIFMESLIILLLVVFFSLITNKIISVSNTIILLFCGHVLNDTKLTNFLQNHIAFKWTLNLYTYIFPNFYRLNLKDFVLYEQTLPPSYLWTNFFYALFYSLFLVFVSCYIFNKKNLD
ncbi:MAG: ABC transporter permease [Bacteriovoracaceae bacterium]